VGGDVRKALLPTKSPFLQKLILRLYIYTFSRVASCDRRVDGYVKMITTDPTPMDIIRYLKIQNVKTLPNKNYEHIMRFGIGLFLKVEDTDSRALKSMKSGHVMERHIPEKFNFKKHRCGKFKYRIKQLYLL